MRRKFSVYQISAVAVAVSSMLLSVVRIIVLKNNIEINGSQSNYYYILKNTETITFLVFAGCFVLAYVVIGFLLGKKANAFMPFDSSPVVFSASLSGFMLLATGLYYSYQYITGQIVSGAKFAISLGMVFASVMFLDLALQKEGQKRKSVTYLRFVVCGYAIMRLVLDFVEQNRIPANSASIFHILGLISFMLFAVYEGIMEFNFKSMRAYIITGYLCVFFLIVYALPNLAITLLDYSLDPYILLSAVDIALAFYVLTRVYSVCAENHKS